QNETKGPYAAKFRVGSTTTINSGESATLTIKATGASSATATQQLALRPPEGPKAVREVNGRVIDLATGRPIADAIVGLLDSAGHNYTTNSSSTGAYRFVSTVSKPISPGSLTVGATKDGFRGSPKTVDGRAGQVVTVDIRLQGAAAPTAEVTALPTPELTDAGVSAEAEEEESLEAVPAGGEDSGGGGLSWMLIILGGLLVALGVGAIVLLLLRRREDDEDDEDEDGEPVAPMGGRRGGPPSQTGRSVYRSGGAEPAMAGRPGEQTMVARPGMADAPTMMHSRAGSEYGADPYGSGRPSPRPPQPGYAAPGAPYGAGAHGAAQPGYPSGAYGSPAHPSSPAGYPATPRSGAGGYGSPAYPQEYGADPGYGGGYAQPEPARHDEPYGESSYGSRGGGGAHSAYEPNYGQGGSGYPAQPGGYGANGSPGPNGGYGPAGGYGAGGDYGSGGYEAGGYGSPAAGYDQRGYDGGYDRGPDQRGGYGQPGGYDQGSYYDEPTGRRAAPPPQQQPSRGDGRPLPWLDD
ncbi:MAG TPA: carboxypeptidase regulatory-like domain-containing protein, partial [Micromonosporaceae bacterium]|nr:carboxypeptidase regulatory-like domain-containing protein [Micromonosporaceae bacterium]